jgi:acetyl-CoA carboxylase biotin carboxyl carrier protein
MSKVSSASAKSSSSAASGDKIDARLVREIATMLSESDLTEIEVEKGDLRIRVARQATVLASAPTHPYAAHPFGAHPFGAHAAPPAPDAEPAVAEHSEADTLTSPMVGTVYLRPSPESKPFIELGDHVTAGHKVLLVEAMKTFNEIVAHKSGAITAILIEDGQPVEYGQPLLVIV